MWDLATLIVLNNRRQKELEELREEELKIEKFKQEGEKNGTSK